MFDSNSIAESLRFVYYLNSLFLDIFSSVFEKFIYPYESKKDISEYRGELRTGHSRFFHGDTHRLLDRGQRHVQLVGDLLISKSKRRKLCNLSLLCRERGEYLLAAHLTRELGPTLVIHTVKL